MPASNNSKNFYISSFFLGLCLYMDFLIGLAPSTSGDSYTSTSFQSGGAHVGTISRETLQY